MARRPTLEIDGVVYRNVYEVSYEINTAKDETGRPSDTARAGVIKITRESEGNTDIARWAMDSSEPNWKGGKVTFMTPDNKLMKELVWKSGFISKYEEHVPHTKEKADEQMFEYFEISCKLLSIGDAEIDNLWD